MKLCKNCKKFKGVTKLLAKILRTGNPYLWEVNVALEKIRGRRH